MSTPAEHAIAIVGVGAILPDAPDAEAFWQNVTGGRYSISEVDPRRWDPDLYYDADPHAPDRTYSKIGGWVRDWRWEPLAWHLPIPPTVSEAMDDAQKWGVACTRMALADYGWPERPLDLERTAVVLGNAMAGEHHYLTSMRLSFPELARELAGTPTYAGLPADARAAIASELHANVEAWLPPTTEDTMPGELGNCLAGRIANLFNLRGPNFVVDAACASAMAAMDASIEGLVEGEFDAVLTGGIDRNMSAATFIKFCAIGALSGTGTRPYRDGADGFVMGEGAGLMLLKRLADAERDGDRIYAVVRGIAGSSDGRGKGLTAPNPIGQKLAVERAWAKSGLTPDACGLIEGHGTSTRVGDVVELTALAEVFAGAGLAPGSVPIGSVKSNIGHLKGAAGAAGLLKAALSLHHKVLPPSLGGEPPNPNLDWSASPFAINTELRDWEAPGGAPRVAGVSAFGFGGTNFHAVLEEYVPGRFPSGGNGSIAVPAEIPDTRPNRRAAAAPPAGAGGTKAPLRGALVLGAADDAGLAAQLRAIDGAAAPAIVPPDPQALRAPERIAIDYGDGAELQAKAALALKALEGGGAGAWKALRARGIFRGSGPAPKLAFLYTGQGSQYANMLAELRAVEPIVAATFAEADEVMRPLLDGRALSDVIFVDPGDEAAVAQATAELMRTEITQPAVLTVDIALTRLLAAYGIEPEIVMGHSLGEYGALVAAGVLPFTQALEAVSARGHEMASLDLGDPGAMAAVAAPPEAVEAVIAQTDGYVVLANVNSSQQVVLGGATQPVHDVVARLQEQGHQAMTLPVSHAFHTEIVAPASEPLRTTLRRLDIAPPRIPVVANVDGELYPDGPDAVDRIIDILGRQVASPVQFVAGLRTLWAQGARVFVETGPKRALQGFASDVLGDDDALNLHTNHPKSGDLPSFNIALCGLYAAGYGVVEAPAVLTPAPVVATAPGGPPPSAAPSSDATLLELGRLFADTLQRGRTLLGESGPAATPDPEPVVITGAGVGLPGTEQVFDEHNLARILHGEQFIDVIPQGLRHAIADRHITRLVKGDDGQANFEEIDDVADVIKLAARAGTFDLESEFGVDAGRIAALGRATQLAVAAGIDALRDAGIPLVQHYRDTTTGTQLPDRWALPDALRDDTGIVFGSAFPGYDEFADELDRFWADRSRRDQLTQLEEILARVPESDEVARVEIERRIHDVRLELDEHAYAFDRRFLFRVLSMGHSQFAELIGARGPNTQLNAACASTTQAVTVAQDWIRAGRCRRVIVIAADDATSDEMLPWIGSGFLASGAAATDEAVEDAALPFDVRRHGMLLGMGAAALVVESAAAARERGVTPICEVLGAVTANSAFHGTRLDVDHIGQVMEGLVAEAETAGGVRRADMAPELVFVSHETYTPARGGSAAAEIHALREVFGDRADSIVIANTKGITGHPMGVGLEDVVAVKTLETGVVPPVPNFRDVDPALGALNLSKGGAYPVRYALRLAAGFGSQVAMLLLRWTPVADGRHRNPEELGFDYRVSDRATWNAWLARVTGQTDPQLEVVQHRLRVVDRGPGAAKTAPAAPATPAAATPAPAAAPAPAPAPEPQAAAPPAGDPILDSVLQVVADQTGYPTDLLDPDLDLEADLGIDTVKQAEVFATIREAWDIPRDDNLKLRDYPTLNHVAQFVRDHTGTPAPAAGAPAADAPPPTADEPADEDPDPSFPRRVPTAVVRPPLDRCLPTGVTLGAGARVILASDAGGVGAALASRLEALGAEVLTLDTALDIAGAEEHVADWLRGGPVTGVYWLPALDDEGPLSGLDPAGWREGLHRRVKLLAATMRPLEPETFLVSATRLGGRLGYDEAGATSVMGGAVSGFTKALARERADALVKVVDVPPSRKTSALADVLLDETLRDPGAVEIGHADDLRWTVALREEPAHADPARALTPATTFLVTGAAGSIVSAITADLAAAAGGGTFHLLDLIGAPDPGDPDLEAIARDRDGLKSTIAQRLRDAGEKPTPKLVERELAGIERHRSALDAIGAIEAAGGTAHWHQCDLTDAAQVATAVDAAVGDDGKLDVLLHCAGLEISHVLPGKPQAEYDLVFDVKADGWFHLLHALGDRHPGTAIVFSSIAGRFGNGGQTDYSAANDLLCKSVSRMRRDGVTRGIAVDWTAWSGIGMASRGSIPKMMEVAGIDMLPPDHGVPVVRRELTAGGDGGEIVVAGALGILLEERHPTGGLDPALAIGGAAGPMTARVTAFGVADGALVEADLDPAREAFLDDHRIDGTPVLPGVMGMEGFAETAAALLPGWRVVALEDVDLSAPLKFYRDAPRTLEFRAQTRDGGDGTLLADCRLVGRRTLAGQGEQETVHFTGRARLARDAAPPPAHEPPRDPDGDRGVGREAVYRVYFHGPAYQVLDHAWREDGHVVGRLADDLPADHAGEGLLAIEPRLIELCFQTAGVWELGTSGRMALPTHVDRAQLFDREGLAPGGRWAIVTPREAGVSDADVVDATGRVLLRLEGYRTIELPGGPGEAELAPIREAMS